MRFWHVFVEVKEFVGVRVESYAGGLLVGSSRLVCFDFSSESFLIGNVVDFTVNTFLIHKSVTSFYISMSITGFFSVLLTMVIFYMISEMVRLGFMKLKRKGIENS